MKPTRGIPLFFKVWLGIVATLMFLFIALSVYAISDVVNLGSEGIAYEAGRAATSFERGYEEGAR